MSESHNHNVLKLLAVEFLYQVKKCKWVTTELKFGNYIYDVCGTDGSSIYIVESKSRHQDFKRDCNDPKVIKENIKEYKRLLKETGDTDYQDKIHKEKDKSIKFFDESIFKLASSAYIIAPKNIIEEDEVPKGWGLLDDEPMTVIPAPQRKIDKKWISKIMGEIGKKHTKMYLKQIGVEFEGKRVIFPDYKLLQEEDDG